MTTRELVACRKRLETFAGEMLGSLRDHRQAGWAQVYLRGLLLEGRRKSVQPMAERLPDGNEQNLQQFLNQSPWAWQPVRAKLAKGLTAALGTGGSWIVEQPAHRWQHANAELPVVWLLIEWPEEAEAPAKYWLSDLPEATSLRTLVRWAKSRWAVEMNYREMKAHLGLDHFEGRGWAGWHHHVTLIMLAFAFLLRERLRRRKRGATSRFPRSWAGSNSFSPPGPVSASSAASPSPAIRGII